MVGLELVTVLAGLVLMVQSGWRVKVAVPAQAERATDGVWKATGETVRERQVGGKLPAQALVWQLDVAALRRVLEQAPMEGRGVLEESAAVVSLPLPEGRLARFRVVDSPVLSPQLATQHPQIKSYRGQGMDNPALTMRCSLTPSGFSALVSDGAQTVMIQPLAWFRQAPPRRADSAQAAQASSNSSNEPAAAGEAMYVSYYGRDYAQSAEEAVCLVKGDAAGFSAQRRSARARRAAAANFAYGETLRTYRIAIATTQGYKGAVSSIGLLNSINIWLNNANGILETELSIRLMLASPEIYVNQGLKTKIK